MSFANFESSPGGFINPDSIAASFGISPGMSIADFGSGTGFFTVLMAQKTGETGKVYALDVQEAPLESVRSRAKAANVENIETKRVNLEVPNGSKLSDGSQDLVLMANVLFQSPDKPSIIKEASRITKSGGRVVAICWKKGTAGFGPPDSLRNTEEEIKAMGESSGLIFSSNIDAGKFHYGIIFTKP